MTVEIDTSEVTAELNRLSQRAQDMRAVFNKIGVLLVGEAQQTLGRGLDPWGNPLKRLKATRGRRVGGIPLNDTRTHIYSRISKLATADSLKIGLLDDSTSGVGRFHQFGTSRIPARPFLPIRNGQVDLPTSWSETIIDSVREHFRSRYTN
jgi:phage gpG-like protein